MRHLRNASQLLLGSALAYAGIGHLTTNRLEFQAQVPTLLEDYADFVVLASGVIEISLGAGLIALWKYRVQIGWLTAIFFIAIFWGNISQYLNHTDAFGLNSDRARAIRAARKAHPHPAGANPTARHQALIDRRISAHRQCNARGESHKARRANILDRQWLMRANPPPAKSGDAVVRQPRARIQPNPVKAAPKTAGATKAGASRTCSSTSSHNMCRR
mgnify:CR=1 FL=1